MNAFERFVVWFLVYLGFIQVVRGINRILDKLDDAMETGNEAKRRSLTVLQLPERESTNVE